jgi:N-methylhydantoinase A/oxoprolinase/acetone carboxylase beta subunit
MDRGNEKRALVACGVFRPEIEALLRSGEAEKIDPEKITILEGGLHTNPARLRKMLQQEIDRLEGDGDCSGIAVLYGLCGRALAGISARSLPLFIPRVHDCISLFLGSDAGYRREFDKNPGTFYITPGWYEEKLTPFASRGEQISLDPSLTESFEGYRRKYGKKNAKAIFAFYNSWRKNYRRSVFIDTGIEQEGGDNSTYRSYASDFAREFGWDYQELEGSSRLIRKLLEAERGDEEILMVPPGASTVYDTRGSSLVIGKNSSLSAFPGKRDSRISQSSRKDDEQLADIRYGLGIDAGGTYTDAVIYDFQKRAPLQSGKGKTTPQQYTIGIEEAVKEMDQKLLRRVGMAAISTTLATNAIVEGKGRSVGLIMMHSGIFDPKKIDTTPCALVSGRLDINGKVLDPVDPAEVRRIGREMAEKNRVEAFAVSAYAGSVNPVQELEVKELLERETGLHVCCGHELSDLYNIYHRANTAVLNARIIPLLEAFLEEVMTFLRQLGIDVPVMVVRGDGTLMSIERAREVPVETALSGPAASVSGARFLTGLEDATVVDVGGTTSDIGKITRARVELKDKGSLVGRWRTHVRALDMSTLGMGGDSMIGLEKGKLQVGPRRILPFCRLSTDFCYEADFSLIEPELDSCDRSSEALSWYYLLPERKGKGGADGFTSSLQEKDLAVLDLLQGGPLSRIEIARDLSLGHWMMTDFSKLERLSLIGRSGLTPTDLLHGEGKMTLWDFSSARALCSLYGKLAGNSLEEFSRRVFDYIKRRLLEEIILKQLPEGEDREGVSSFPLLRYLVGDRAETVQFRAALRHPVIGLGAPVSFFLEGMSARAGVEIIVPPHAEVANAIGAVTSSVSVSTGARIIPVEEGFGVRGIGRVMDFESFDRADSYAREQLSKEVLRLAKEAGTASQRVEFDVEDILTQAADGSEIFIERSLSARVNGAPDLVSLGG